MVYKNNKHLEPEACRKRGFQKGQVSNPKGRTPIIREVQALAKEQTELAVNTLVEIMTSEKTTGSARVQAAVALLDRGWGRPKQSVDIKVDHDASGLAAALDALQARERAVALAPPVIEAEVIDVTVIETVKDITTETAEQPTPKRRGRPPKVTPEA